MKDLNNTAILCTSEKQGAKIIKFYEKHGFSNPDNFIGSSESYYYGVENGKIVRGNPLSKNLKVIKLPKEKDKSLNNTYVKWKSKKQGKRILKFYKKHGYDVSHYFVDSPGFYGIINHEFSYMSCVEKEMVEIKLSKKKKEKDPWGNTIKGVKLGGTLHCFSLLSKEVDPCRITQPHIKVRDYCGCVLPVEIKCENKISTKEIIDSYMMGIGRHLVAPILNPIYHKEENEGSKEELRIKSLVCDSYDWNIFRDLKQKEVEGILKHRELLLAQMLESKGICIDFEKEAKRKFKRIRKEVTPTWEIYYYDDGSLEGLYLISFARNIGGTELMHF